MGSRSTRRNDRRGLCQESLDLEPSQAPVKIANYELLMRDRSLLDDGLLQFDLVVLDEAQRIKNRNSTTSEIVRSIPDLAPGL